MFSFFKRLFGRKKKPVPVTAAKPTTKNEMCSNPFLVEESRAEAIRKQLFELQKQQQIVKPPPQVRRKYYAVPPSYQSPVREREVVIHEDPIDNTDLNALLLRATLAASETSSCNTDDGNPPVDLGEGSFSGAGASGNWEDNNPRQTASELSCKASDYSDNSSDTDSSSVTSSSYNDDNNN